MLGTVVRVLRLRQAISKSLYTSLWFMVYGANIGPSNTFFLKITKIKYILSLR